MITTAVIAFREFLEAFLIVGVFLGISKRLNLSRELEIGIAATLGFVISILLASTTFIFGDVARGVLTEERAEILESYLLIFSGFFIAYVVFSLHNIIRMGRGGKLISAHRKLAKNAFDISLFLSIVMLVVREGFEIALFTASTSLFAVFLQNFLGLMSGFFLASVVGALAYFTYIKFPIGRVFRATEYMIILLGAALVQNGVTELLEHSFGIHISDIWQFPLQFMPSKDSIIGHFLRNMVGIDSEFSLARLGIMLAYITGIYLVFLRKNKPAV
ncbi:FTR1 family protein [Candidatus Curtissbacteria bacterium]|nr:FTR1 family protein [Candidatus Curtissbacteria bacterium]